MAGSHVHALYRHGDSILHRIAPHTKIVAIALAVFGFVATPRTAVWAFAIYALLLIGAMRLAGFPLSFVARRMVIELPFLVVALTLPFFTEGERTMIGPLSLSIDGLWAMWNVVAKATLGLMASIVLAGTTPVSELLRGLGTLRMPKIITSITGLMIRYLDVVLGEFGRMRVAMQSRGFAPRTLKQATPYATSLGALFVRSYERGERVHLAMASRGFSGRMPSSFHDGTALSTWAMVLAFPALVWTLAVASLVAQ